MWCSDTMPAMPDASTPTETTTSRSARFWRGMGLGTPIFLGYMPVGMAFGVLATTLGFSVFQAVTCSATAFAGAGQFITLSLMRAGEAAIAVVAATTVVNLRHVLFAATISPYLRGVPARRQAFLAFTLTDETFARQHQRSAGRGSPQARPWQAWGRSHGPDGSSARFSAR